MDEIWKEVKGWNGKYLISNLGRLKSIGGKYKLKYPDGYITLGAIEMIGYRVVTMRRPGFKERNRIHVLVANHFCDKPIGSQCVNHIDGNRLNNHSSNLEWTTTKGNIQHAVRTGLMDMKGEKHPMSKLTREQVIQMRRFRKIGITYQRLGEMYGVERRQASDVVRGINWGWLKDEL